MRCILWAVAFAKIMKGLTLVLILSGLFCCLSFRCRLEGLVVLRIEAEHYFCLDSCLKEGIRGEVILTLAYGGTYL